jgi:hypothetical protein
VSREAHELTRCGIGVGAFHCGKNLGAVRERRLADTC